MLMGIFYFCRQNNFFLSAHDAVEYMQEYIQDMNTTSLLGHEGHLLHLKRSKSMESREGDEDEQSVDIGKGKEHTRDVN